MLIASICYPVAYPSHFTVMKGSGIGLPNYPNNILAYLLQLQALNVKPKTPICLCQM